MSPAELAIISEAERVERSLKDSQPIVRPNYECTLFELSERQKQLREAYYKASYTEAQLSEAASCLRDTKAELYRTLTNLEWDLYHLEDKHGLTGVTKYATRELLEADRERTLEAQGGDSA